MHHSKDPVLTVPVNKEALDVLSQIFQMEVAGISRYLHYSFMIMGHNRIPIQKWLRDQASESMDHAILLGEKITAWGGHPPLPAAPIEESRSHTIADLLQESLVHEEGALSLYKKLVKLAADDIALEEFARSFVRTETEHIEEVQKMMRSPK